MENLAGNNLSFAGKVKTELSNAIPKSRHCQLAELMAITAFCGIKKKR